MVKIFKIPVLFLSIASGLVLSALAIRSYNAHRYHFEEQTRHVLGTYVTIYAVGPEKTTVRAINSAMKRVEEIHDKFSIHNTEGPIYLFNQKGVPISDVEILAVVNKAIEIGKASAGAFDITISPLSDLWGFKGKNCRIPDDAQIQKCLENIGYHHLCVKEGMLTKDRDCIKIDLGGIAKGYALGEAARVLKNEGVTSALIDAGGDIYAMGKKGKTPWRVGIKNPRGDGDLGFFEVEDMAVVGSGDYERFFIQGGRRYHHIMNPATGHPANGLQGITLIHPDPMAADAWNTALFVLGPQKGMEIVGNSPDMETVMIDDQGKMTCSSGLKNRLDLKN